MNNKFFPQNTTKLGLIALSIFGTMAVSVPLNFTVNPVLAQNNINNNEGKKFQADKSLNEGMTLFKQGTKESLEQAIIKFKQALTLYQEIENKAQESLTCFYLGLVNNNLGFKQEALNYYNQALPLKKAVGDRTGEANILNNIGSVYSDLGDKQKALNYYEQSLILKKAIGDRSGAANTLNNIANVYSDLGFKQKALEYYEQSLPLKRAVGDRSGEANILIGIGKVYSALGKKQKALEYYQQSLQLKRAVGDRLGEANILNNIGLVYNALGEKQKALEYYQKSLQLTQALSDKNAEATTLNNIGLVYDDLGKKQQALDYYQRSLTLFKVVGDPLGYANILNNIGLVSLALGEKQKALEYYQQSLVLNQKVGDRKAESNTLNHIGNLYSILGEKQKALEYYQRSLPLKQAVGDRSGYANILNNIGSVYSDLGEKQKALEYYQRSLPLKQAVGDPLGYANILISIGKVYSDLGEKQKALEYYQRSLSLKHIVGDRTGEANILNNIGSVYSDLGEKQKALEYYQRSLPLKHIVGDRTGEANILNNIANVYSDLGFKQKALEYYEQSLPLKRAVGDRTGEANILIGIGKVYLALKEKQKALEYYQQSLQLKRAVGDRSGEAKVLGNIGIVYSELGEKQKALESYQQSLSLYQTVGDLSNESNTLLDITVAEYHQGNLQTALTNIKSAVTIIEDLRTKIVSQDLRTSYFASVQNYYQLYIEILMKLHKQNPKSGYNITAFEVSEQARSRSLLDLLNESKADLRQGIDPQLKQKQQELIQKLTIKTQKQLKLSSQGEEKKTQLKAVINEVEEIKTQLQQLEAEIRSKNPRYAALTQAQSLKLQEIQQQLDKDTVLLSYWVGDKESYLWVISSNSLTSYLLPNQTEIKKLAGGFLSDTLEGDPSLKKAKNKALELTKIILKPAQSELQNKRLIIVPDGKLQYIPFNALATLNSNNYQDFKPLLVEHEIINLPSASTIGFIRKDTEKRKTAPKTLAVIADPVFGNNDDDRVKPVNVAQNHANSDTSNLDKIKINLGKRGGLDRLPGTRKEAEKILSLVPESQSKRLFDFEANLTNFNNSDLSQYRIIHLGNHGIVNEVNPELSVIVLSLVDKQGKEQNGLLMTPDIFNLNLPADLIVLSACETAKGKDVKGEGIVGLTRGFMYAGTSRLMLSLWQVDDEETSVLMSRFYEGMLKEKLTPAASLRKAQLSMWKEGKAPYYWSAFILQGEWK